MPLHTTHFTSLPIVEYYSDTAPHDLPVPSKRKALEAFDKINLLLEELPSDLPDQLFDELSIINAFILTR